MPTSICIGWQGIERSSTTRRRKFSFTTQSMKEWYFREEVEIADATSLPFREPRSYSERLWGLCCQYCCHQRAASANYIWHSNSRWHYFYDPCGGSGVIHDHQAEIEVKVLPSGDAQTSKTSHQMPPFEFQELKNKLQEMCKWGFIQTNDLSEDVPVVLVWNKDGGFRMFRTIAREHVGDCYAMMRCVEMRY